MESRQQLEESLERLRTRALMKSDDVWNRFKLARTLHRLDRTAEAATEYSRVLALKPDHGEAAYLKSTLLDPVSERAEVERLLQVAVAADPALIEGWKLLVDIRRGDGITSGRVVALEALTRLATSDAAVAREYAQVLRDSVAANPEEVCAAFRRAQQLEPARVDFAEEWLAYSVTARNADWAKEAVDALVRVDAGSLAANCYLAESLLASGRAEDASIYGDRALLRDSENLSAMRVVVRIAIDRGRFAEAVPIAEQLVARSEASGDDHFVLATVLSELGRHSEAVSEYTRAAREGADSPTLRLGLGRSRVALGEDLAAVPELKAAAEGLPAVAAPRLLLAKVYRNLGRSREAQQVLSEALTLSPEDAETQRVMAELALAAGDTVAAKHAFREALRLAPRHTATARALASLLLESKEFESAAGVLELAERVVEEPATAELLAVAYSALGRHVEALRELEKVSDSPQKFAAVGLAYLRTDNAGLAVAALRRAVAGGIADAEIHLAEALLATANGPEALSLLESSVRSGRAGAGASALLARALAASGDSERAELAIRRALKDSPNDESVLRASASLLREQRRLPEARDILERLRWITSDDLSILSALGEVLLELDDAPAALPVLVLASASGTSDDLRRLASCHVRMGQDVEAEAVLAGANRLADDAGALFMRGGVAERLGRISAALEYYRAASRVSPKDPEPLVAACRCLRIIQRVPEALAVGRQAVAMSPSNLGARLEAGLSACEASDFRTGVEWLNPVVEDPKLRHSAIGWLGRALLETGVPAKAVVLLDEAATLNPLWLHSAAEAHAALQEWRRAAELLETVPGPHDEGLRERLAKYWRMAGDVARSVAVLSDLAEQSTDAKTILAAAAALADELGDHGRAAGLYSRAIGLGAAAAGELGLAKISVAGGDFERALEHGARAAAVEPNSAEALRVLALSCCRLGRFGQALPHLNRLVLLADTDVGVRVLRAEAFSALGRPHDAIPDLEFVVRTNPRSSGPIERLAALLEQIGAPDRADEWLSFVFDRTGEPQVLRARAALLERLGRLADARDCLAQAVTLVPDARSLCSLSVLELRLGNPSGAVQAVELAATINPNDGNVQAAAALAYVSVGRSSDAVAAYRKALDLDLDLDEVRLGLARCLEATGDLQAATMELMVVARRRPTDTALHLRLGTLLHRVSNWTASIDALTHVLRLDPAKVEARLLLGRSFLKLGNVLAAREQHRWIETRDPNTAYQLLRDIQSAEQGLYS